MVAVSDKVLEGLKMQMAYIEQVAQTARPLTRQDRENIRLVARQCREKLLMLMEGLGGLPAAARKPKRAMIPLNVPALISIRTRAGKSQMECSIAAGFSEERIGHIESEYHRGRRGQTITKHKLAALARYLGCTPSDLKSP